MAGPRQTVRWSITAIASAFAIYLVLLARTDRSLDRGFRSVGEGATREEVVGLLGAPDEVRSGCRDLPTWMNRPVLESACAEEVEYRATLRPVFWTVGFDSNGRAIAKYRYVSR